MAHDAEISYYSLYSRVELHTDISGVCASIRESCFRRAKAKEEEAIEMALPWLRGKVDTGRYHSTGGAKKSKRAIKLPVSPDRLSVHIMSAYMIICMHANC